MGPPRVLPRANVRFGSEADAAPTSHEVRFVPQAEVRDGFAWQPQPSPTPVRPKPNDRLNVEHMPIAGLATAGIKSDRFAPTPTKLPSWST